MYHPCKQFSTCPDPAELAATQNFSSERAEVQSWFGRFQCQPGSSNNPLFRTAISPRSQLEADLAAASCLHERIITNDEQSCSGCGVTVTQLAGTVLGVSKVGANATARALACLGINTVCPFSNTPQSCTVACPGGPNTYTVPAGTFFAPTQAQANSIAANTACANSAICGGGVFNVAQECTIFCPQTNANITTTVEAGIFFGLTQADADAAAHDIACALAFINCQAMPPLVGNQVEVCSQECGGVTVTYTVPAGVFVSYDQISANLIAFQFCVEVLSTACQQGVQPEQANVGSTPQTCQFVCAGGGTFSSTLQAGAFRSENQAAANAAALSFCQLHVAENSFCLGALTEGVCVNNVYAEVVSTTGPGTPTTMGITSGQLPPGLSLSGGILSGIPTSPGSYTFTISAASGFGFAQRTYTISVGEITPDTLPAGAVGAVYAAALTATGFNNPVFSVEGGSLPSGVSLQPFTGVLSGTPDTAGTFSFVIGVTES